MYLIEWAGIFSIFLIFLLLLLLIFYQKYESDLIKNDLKKERFKTNDLLTNILPEEIAFELLNSGKSEPRYFESATLVLTDFVGFTKIAEILSPIELIEGLDRSFGYFDTVLEKFGVEKKNYWRCIFGCWWCSHEK